MSVVKINVLTVPAERRDVLEERFGARAGEVDSTPGFESFQLLRPTDDSDRYFVVTQWESEDAFEAWMASRAFQRGHAGGGSDGGGAMERTHGADGTHGTDGAHGTDDEAAGQHASRRPAATDAELLSFEVVQESTAQR